MRSLLLLPAILLGMFACQKANTPPISIQVTVTPEEKSIQRGIAFLLSRQSDDGAWRSEVYGHFRDGDALTPLVITALQSISDRERVADSIERGMVWLDGLVVETTDGFRVDPKAHLTYPVYTAALATRALRDPAQAKRLPKRAAWKALLLDYQCGSANGWKQGDRPFGGWGYYGVTPRKPAEGPIPAAWEANLSATAYALTALREAGVAPDHPAMVAAHDFLDRCWNYASAKPDPMFDDGGYFFSPDDPFRNKAGIAGRPGERIRFHSYGSATADGLRCEKALGHRGKVQPFARDWLIRHLVKAEPFHQHGTFTADREADRNGARYYYAAALRDVMEAQHLRAMKNWLLATQRDDGSWRNEIATVREDDPIVATALAILAMDN